MSRALHPREAALLRHLLPAIKRIKHNAEQVAHRTSEYERAKDLSDGRAIADDPYLRSTTAALALSKDVHAQSLDTFYRAVCAQLGAPPYGTEEELDAALRGTLAVIEGGKGKRS